MAQSILVRTNGVYSALGDLVGDSILVENSKLVKTGFDIKSTFSKEIRVDGYLLPPLTDAHIHLESTGLTSSVIDLRNARKPLDVALMLARSKGPIAFGRGWDQESFEGEKRFPTRRELDMYVSDRPAIAIRICGHLAVVNTKTLLETKVDKVYPNLVKREAGVIYEDAVYYVVSTLLKNIDSPSLVRRALKELAMHGVFGASSMSCSLKEASAVSKLSGAYGVRAVCYISQDAFESALTKGYGLLGDRKAVVGVKLFSDGSLGARTAYLRTPYHDDPNNRGVSLLSSNDISRIGSEALKHGLRLAVHAIGDAALDEVIEAYDNLISSGANPKLLRVEHASISWPEQINRMAELGFWTVVQPRFRVSDWWIGNRLGPERAHRAYVFRTMLRRGVKLAISSDSPVEPFDPIETVKSAIGLCNTIACRDEESLTPREVLYLYTMHSAEASGGLVAQLGDISKGSPAVFTVSNIDILSSSSKEFHHARFKGLNLEHSSADSVQNYSY